MCKFISLSFFYNMINGDIACDLNTAEKLKWFWCKGYYTPDDEVKLQGNPENPHYHFSKEKFKKRFPTYLDFQNWYLKQKNEKEEKNDEIK